MVHIKPDLEAGTAEERAEVPPPPAQYDHYAEDTDEEPDVEDIEVGDWTIELETNLREVSSFKTSERAPTRN